MTEKFIDPIKKAREHIQNGTYILTTHATDQLEDRLIDSLDVLYVLKNAFHEKAKTLFDVKTQTWKYAIRGRTSQGNELRIIVKFAGKMVIITVMRVR